MTEVVFVGGFGSSPEQMQNVARRGEAYLGRAATGICFRESLQHQEEFSELINGKTVLTHSGGIYAVNKAVERGAEPTDVTSFAVPVPEQVRLLLLRGTAIQLGVTAPIEPQLRQKFEGPSDFKKHFMGNARYIMPLGHFDALQKAGEMTANGVPTTVGLMAQDGLFDYSTESVTESVVAARELGARVLELPGGHCRFTHETVAMLAEKDTAPDFSTGVRPGDLSIRSLARIVYEQHHRTPAAVAA